MSSHWRIANSGRIASSTTPQELWENATRYFQWSDDNPIITSKTLTSGKEAGKVVTNTTIRPYSIKALCLHCGILEEWLRDIRSGKDKSSLYYIVVSKILYIIFIQNMEMAIIGEFNPIFTAKVLNIDKDDTPTGAVTVTVVSGLPALSNSESEILEKLELENGFLKKDKSQNS